MRDLTEEELKLAPEWATHYHVNHNESILFECNYQYCLYEKSTGMTSPSPCVGVCDESNLLPPKSFDITKHEFGDTVQHFESDGLELSLYCVDGFRHIELYKDDAIAIAKELGVTGEDLK